MYAFKYHIRTPKVDLAGFIMAGRNENMVKLPKNRQIQPAIIKRTKVYYLRLLLDHQPGPTSFTHSLTSRQLTVKYHNLQEACRRHSLLDNKDYIIDAMSEISETLSALKLLSRSNGHVNRLIPYLCGKHSPIISARIS